MAEPNWHRIDKAPKGIGPLLLRAGSGPSDPAYVGHQDPTTADGSPPKRRSSPDALLRDSVIRRGARRHHDPPPDPAVSELQAPGGALHPRWPVAGRNRPQIRSCDLCGVCAAWLDRLGLCAGTSASPALPDSERRTSYSITARASAHARKFPDLWRRERFSELGRGLTSTASRSTSMIRFGWTITSPTGPLGNIAAPDHECGSDVHHSADRRRADRRRPPSPPGLAVQRKSGRLGPQSQSGRLTDIIAQNREIWDKTNDVTGRGLFFPPGFTSGPLPPPSDCANSFLTFGSSGSYPICVSTSGGILPSGNIQTVGSEVVLAARATTSFPNGVWRLDFSAGLGAPPLFYVPSVGACSLNAGAGDGGSQVPSSNGKCWLAKFGPEADIRQWGARPNRHC